MITFFKNLCSRIRRDSFFQERVVTLCEFFLNLAILKIVENFKNPLSLKVYLCQRDMFLSNNQDHWLVKFLCRGKKSDLELWLLCC